MFAIYVSRTAHFVTSLYTLLDIVAIPEFGLFHINRLFLLHVAVDLCCSLVSTVTTSHCRQDVRRGKLEFSSRPKRNERSEL